MTMSAARSVKLWSPDLAWKMRDNGEYIVWRKDPLGPYPDKLNERLVHWATVSPDRVWMADRHGRDAWREVTYAQALDGVRRIGQFLLDHGLSSDRPLLILSENSIEHALMALGAQHVGIPSAAIAPAYATSQDLGKLTDIRNQITPGLVFAEDAAPISRALAEVFADGTPVVAPQNLPAGRANCFTFEDVLSTVLSTLSVPTPLPSSCSPPAPRARRRR
jgi:feruloyl-CoA synthase